MSSKSTLQTNNNTISGYNDRLANIINTINNLPEAGSGTSEDLSTELSTQTGLLNTQDLTIDDIEAALEGKAAGGGGGSGVTFAGGAINHTENMGYLYTNAGFINTYSTYRVIVTYYDYVEQTKTDQQSFNITFTYDQGMSELFGAPFYIAMNGMSTVGAAMPNNPGSDLDPEITFDVDMIQIQPPSTTTNGIADYVFIVKL